MNSKRLDSVVKVDFEGELLDIDFSDLHKLDQLNKAYPGLFWTSLRELQRFTPLMYAVKIWHSEDFDQKLESDWEDVAVAKLVEKWIQQLIETDPDANNKLGSQYGEPGAKLSQVVFEEGSVELCEVMWKAKVNGNSLAEINANTFWQPAYFSAVKNKDVEVLRSVIEGGEVDVNLQSGYRGWTILLFCLRFGKSVEGVRMCVEAGCDVMAKTRHPKNGLSILCDNTDMQNSERERVMRYLMAKGVPTDDRVRLAVAGSASWEMYQLVREAGGDFSDAWKSACANREPRILKDMIERGEMKFDRAVPECCQQSPIFENIKTLVEKGGNLQGTWYDKQPLSSL